MFTLRTSFFTPTYKKIGKIRDGRLLLVDDLFPLKKSAPLLFSGLLVSPGKSEDIVIKISTIPAKDPNLFSEIKFLKSLSGLENVPVLIDCG